MPSKLMIYNLKPKAQVELIKTVTSKENIELLTISFDEYGEVIEKAVKKLFIDDDIKAKFEKYFFIFKPLSLLTLEKEFKLFHDNKRDPFNKNELMDFIYTYAVIVFFLIVREQNEFYKDFIGRLDNLVDNIGAKLPKWLRDPNKIYAPILSTIDQVPNNDTPEIKCFYELEEKVYKMS